MARSICSIKNCFKFVAAYGFCPTHRWRFIKYGNPLKITRRESGSGTITRGGYKVIYVNGKRIPEQRYIMEQHLGRKLKPFPYEVVHHINGNTLDNRVKNLKIMSDGSHVSIHQIKNVVKNGKRICSKCKKEFPLSRFSKANYTKVGYRANCKDCQNKYNKERLKNI